MRLKANIFSIFNYENGYLFSVYHLYFHCLPGDSIGFQTPPDLVRHRVRCLGPIRMVLFRTDEEAGSKA